MKKLIVYLILITAIIISCEQEKPSLPSDFTASQGTYVGVVHLAYSKSNGEAIVYRFNEDNAQWEEIAWTWSNQWDDQGYLLPNGIIPGKEYRYKMRIYEEGKGDEFSDYSQEITGYAFNGESTEITSVNRENYDDKVNITINWTNPNDLSNIKNLQVIYYDIYRTEDGNYADYEIIKSVYSDFNNGNPEYNGSYEDNSLDPEKNYSYKIVTRYMYDFNDSNGDYRDYNTYSCDGSSFDDEGDEGDEGNPTVDYTTTDLGLVYSGSDGGIIDIKEKVTDNTVYVGAITDASLYGKPALYQFDGSNWQQVWNEVPEIELDAISFAVSDNQSYFAGIRDSLVVYEWDGSSWSDNLTPDNLGNDDSPSGVSIETYNNELYMAIKQHPDYDLQVLKYNGSSWDTIGGIIASGSIYEAELENIDGTLYLHYLNDNTLHIKHLSGSSWTTDLQWEQEWLHNINLDKTNNELYFSSGSASTDFDGGVYHVLSTSSVENLIPEEHEDWFTMGAFDFAIDTDGNLIVASMKYEFADESQTTLVNYPHLNVYDGTEWKTISGDFTDGVIPVTVSTVGTDIYYNYGDAETVNDTNDPSTLKSKKLSK